MGIKFKINMENLELFVLRFLNKVIFNFSIIIYITMEILIIIQLDIVFKFQ